MSKKHGRIPLQVTIEIELLKFKDSIGHIHKSQRAGHINATSAHRMKNELALIYAQHIRQLIEQEENRDQ